MKLVRSLMNAFTTNHSAVATQNAVTKTEGGVKFSAKHYAYVPDPDEPSTWKLRLYDKPGDSTPSAALTGDATAALGPKGWRGHKVQIPEKDLAGVKAKVAAAYTRARKGKASSVKNALSVLRCNLSTSPGSPVRYDTLDGKRYLVAPMVMITEGVHNGSGGPLYYPPEELAKTPQAWNHKPVTLYHPTANGQGVSACEPDVVNAQRLGFIFNTIWDAQAAKLRAEAWLDEEKVKAIEPGLIDSIEKGKIVELSTGLFTDNEAAEGDWKGEHYTAIARNYRPDHLAILPDQRGSCSIADGAGFLRTNASHDEIRSHLTKALDKLHGPDDYHYVDAVYDDKVVSVGRGGKTYAHDYKRSADGNGVELVGEPQLVMRKVSYLSKDGKPVANDNSIWDDDTSAWQEPGPDVDLDTVELQAVLDQEPRIKRQKDNDNKPVPGDFKSLFDGDRTFGGEVGDAKAPEKNAEAGDSNGGFVEGPKDAEASRYGHAQAIHGQHPGAPLTHHPDKSEIKVSKDAGTKAKTAAVASIKQRGFAAKPTGDHAQGNTKVTSFQHPDGTRADVHSSGAQGTKIVLHSARLTRNKERTMNRAAMIALVVKGGVFNQAEVEKWDEKRLAFVANAYVKNDEQGELEVECGTPEEEENEGNKTGLTGEGKPKPKKKTADEVSDGSTENAEAIQNAINSNPRIQRLIRMEQAEKDRLIKTITSNKKSSVFTANELKAKELEELQKLAHIAAPEKPAAPVGNFAALGDAFAPAFNQAPETNAEEALPLLSVFPKK